MCAGGGGVPRLCSQARGSNREASLASGGDGVTRAQVEKWGAVSTPSDPGPGQPPGEGGSGPAPEGPAGPAGQWDRAGLGRGPAARCKQHVTAGRVLGNVSA